MNISSYSEEIQKLIHSVPLAIYDSNNRVFSSLKKLEPIAKQKNDDSLLGFVYYTYALGYLLREKHEKFIDYLKLAIKHLLRTGEKDYLARAYNLFAVEAKTNGCYEIAYDYYNIASSFVKGDKDSLPGAMMDANLGDLSSQMGDYKKACAYMKKSIPTIKRHSEESTFFKNTLIIQSNLGLCCLSLNDIKEAKKVIDELDRYSKEELADVGEDVEIMILLLRFRYALITKNKKDFESVGKKVFKVLDSNLVVSELVKEFKTLFNELLKFKYVKQADKLIKILQKKYENNIYASMILADMKKDYYELLKMPKKVLETYIERDELTRKQLSKQNQTAFESIELMKLLKDLRTEGIETQEENTILQNRAETDALTNLPNRYALNRYLDNAYSTALENNGRIGLGIADIDGFKNYNDTYGHLKGDECLISVSEVLADIAKKHNVFVARYGGDEFVFIYNDKSEKEILKIEKEMYKKSPISITHGFTTAIVDENKKIWDYLAEADRILYRKKKRR